VSLELVGVGWMRAELQDEQLDKAYVVSNSLTEEKVHIDHSQAIKRLNDAQIPLFISEKKGGIDDSLKDLHGFLSKKMDKTDSVQGKKKLKGILNRLSKIKSDLANFK
jgi:uncharacterized protein (DUF2225 family)